MASAQAVLDIIARDKASKVLNDVGDNARKAGKELDEAGKGGGRFSKVLGNLGTSLPIVGAAISASVLAVGALASSVVDTSSRLEALRAKAQTVFGDQIGLVERWAERTANKMKLTSAEAVGLATNFADLLIPMGFTREAAANVSTEVIGLSGALSKWSGGQRTAAEVADILAGAMLGEYDSLKSLGIGLSAAEVQARLVTKGQQDLTGAALQQAQALAVQELIMEKSTDAQAAYAKGNLTLRDRLDNVKVKLREVWEQLVERLTPSLERFADWLGTTGTTKLAEFQSWLQRNKEEVAALALQVVSGGLQIGEGMLRMAAVAADGFAIFVENAATTLRYWIGWADKVLAVAQSAFIWLPGVGSKIGEARDQLGGLKQTVEEKMPAVSAGLRKSADQARDAADEVSNIRQNINSLRDKVVTVTVRGVNNIDRGLDSALAGRVGARAMGGPVSPGSYLVGERGPELFKPSRGGTVLNAAQTRSALGADTADLVAEMRAVRAAINEQTRRQRDFARQAVI